MEYYSEQPSPVGKPHKTIVDSRLSPSSLWFDSPSPSASHWLAGTVPVTLLPPVSTLPPMFPNSIPIHSVTQPWLSIGMGENTFLGMERKRNRNPSKVNNDLPGKEVPCNGGATCTKQPSYFLCWLVCLFSLFHCCFWCWQNQSHWEDRKWAKGDSIHKSPAVWQDIKCLMFFSFMLVFSRISLVCIPMKDREKASWHLVRSASIIVFDFETLPFISNICV